MRDFEALSNASKMTQQAHAPSQQSKMTYNQMNLFATFTLPNVTQTMQF